MERLSGVHWASPVYADGRIYILSEEGVTLGSTAWRKVR